MEKGVNFQHAGIFYHCFHGNCCVLCLLVVACSAIHKEILFFMEGLLFNSQKAGKKVKLHVCSTYGRVRSKGKLGDSVWREYGKMQS